MSLRYIYVYMNKYCPVVAVEREREQSTLSNYVAFKTLMWGQDNINASSPTDFPLSIW